MRLIDIFEWSKFMHEKLDNIYPESIHDRGYRHAMQDVDAWIAEHTIEAEPVRHGRWIERPNTKGQVYCSECGTLEKITDNNFKSRRCPNCGAKMDKEC